VLAEAICRQFETTPLQIYGKGVKNAGDSSIAALDNISDDPLSS
jgi:hypothetical protein